MLRAAKSVLSSAALAALTGLGTAAVAPAQSAQPQTFSTLAIKADVVLSPEFCATTMKKGSVWTVKESFAVGENTCPKLETELAKIFTGLSRISKLPEPNDGAADIILVPKFGDIGATMAVGAFSNRELVVVLEWTALDRAGKTLWVQTVQRPRREIRNTDILGARIAQAFEQIIGSCSFPQAAVQERTPHSGHNTIGLSL